LTSGFDGSPRDQYKQHAFTVPTTLPPTHVAILGYTNAKKLIKALGGEDDMTTASATLYPEPGPFNDAFQSTAYMVFNYGLAAVNILVLLFSAYYVIRLWRAGSPVIDVRVGIFLSGWICTLFLATQLFMRFHAWPRYVLGHLEFLINSSAFFLLMNIWISMLSPTGQIPSRFSPIRLIIYFLVLVVAMRESIDFATLAYTSSAIKPFKQALDYFYFVLMAYVSGVFIFYATRFWTVAKLQGAVSRPLRRSMIHLSVISGIGATSFVIKTLTDYQFHHYLQKHSDVGWTMTVQLMKYAGTMMRSLALLAVIAIRGPGEAGGETDSQLSGGSIFDKDFLRVDTESRGRGETDTSDVTAASDLQGGMLQAWQPKPLSPVVVSYTPESFPR